MALIFGKGGHKSVYHISGSKLGYGLNFTKFGGLKPRVLYQGYYIFDIIPLLKLKLRQYLLDPRIQNSILLK